MREELANAHPLARAINILPLESGHAQTFATVNTSEERLLQLRENPYTSDDDLRACWQAYQNFVATYLQRSGTRTFLMSNPYITRDWFLRWLRRTPLRLGREWSDWSLCGDYMCFHVTGTVDKRRIHGFFDDVQALTTFGVLTQGVELPVHDELPQETLEMAVTQADYVVVGAYSDNGALIWSR